MYARTLAPNAVLISHAESAPATPVRSLPDSSPYKWIVHPAVDLLFCCGGMVWILSAIHWFIARPSGNLHLLQMLAICSIAGAHLLSETHIAATLTRIFGSAQARYKFRPYTTVVPCFFLFLAVCGLTVPGVTPVLARIYLLWVAQHFTAQTYGIVLVYCYKSGYQLSKYDKLIMRLLLNATALFAMVRQLTYKEWSANGFLAQKVPFWGPLPEWVGAAIAAVLAVLAIAQVVSIARNWMIRKQLMPLPAVLTLITGISMFVATRDQVGVLFLYLPAFYHGSQYVALSLAYYLKERGLPENIPGREIYRAMTTEAAVQYLGLLLLIALTVYLAVPRLLEEFGFGFTLSFATVFLVFNLHHFVTDMAIWRLRDQKTRQLLI